MSSEPNNQASGEDQDQNGMTDGQTMLNVSTDELLKSSVDRESVVNFIEGMVQAMGYAAVDKMPQLPKKQQEQAPPARKFQSKAVGAIMQKLERLEKYPDQAKSLQEDATVLEWIGHNGCKQKDYYEELELAQELTSFFGGHRKFDLAIKSASKALSITLLHRREDTETLAEAYWVLAELHAATDKMDEALNHMSKCLELMEPGAQDPNHPTYKELLANLVETRERSLMVAV
ncbi:MAG: tetratricopeptide repeat protein [Candidatus Obscuribacterales bacterium]|nr:tetratricopeptide repeat protein [Candidatus Obscuribacterales bacterium]